MKSREELLKSKGYWIAKIQVELFRKINDYIEKNNLSKTQLADKLGVTKGYVTQLLNGNFDHKLSKLVELSLAIGKIPEINLDTSIEEYIQKDRSLQLKTSGTVRIEGLHFGNESMAHRKPTIHLVKGSIKLGVQSLYQPQFYSNPFKPSKVKQNG